MPLIDQLFVFLWILAIGMLLGFCHIVYRAIGDTLKLKKIGTFAGDIIFWILLTVIVFAVLLRANYGQVRLYVFIGLLLGALFFTRALGKIAYRLVMLLFFAAGRTAGFLAKLLFYVWRVLTLPFRAVFLVVIFPFHLLGNLARPSFRRARGKIAPLAGSILKKIIPRR